ncbi:MAG: RDD family protein [Myxococcales bacterium]|nr:RDD family protein [Myxococcales bacterium]
MRGTGLQTDLALSTPERVSLALPVAGIGYRSIAYLVDVLLLLLVWTVAFFLYTLAGRDLLEDYEGMSGLWKALAIIGAFATQWLYWTASEVLWNGQTPGKRLLRIRVAREDGAPTGFFESAVRNLCRVVDFLPVAYATGLLTMLLTRQHRRLGDLLAGTLLVREEKIDLDKYTRSGAVEALPVPGAAAAGLPPLPPAEVELLLAFLSRRPTLAPEARRRLAFRMLEHFAQGLPDSERAALGSSLEAAEAFLHSRAQGG